MRHRIADFGGFEFLDAGDDVSDLTGRKAGLLQRLGCEYADLLAQVLRACGHQADAILGLERPLHHPNQNDDTDVIVEP